MSHRSPGPAARDGDPTRSTRGTWAVVAVLLAVGIVAPLLVFVYDQETPTLFGFPFYYWFQFLLIPIVSALTYTAFRLSQSATRHDRARLGLRGPDDHGEGTR